MIYWWVLIFLFFCHFYLLTFLFFQSITLNTFLTSSARAIANFSLQLNKLSYWFWSFVFNWGIVANLLKPVCLSSGTILIWDIFLQLIFDLISFLSNIKIPTLISDYIKAECNDSSFQSLRWREDNSDSLHECILEPVDQRLSSPYSNTDISTYPFLVLTCQ